MVLAIKIQDNIFVPQVIIDNVKHIFGENYSTAQNAIKGIFPTKDETSFESKFFNKIISKFTPTLIFNLYHLVDSQKIADDLIADNSFNNNLIGSNPNPNPLLLRPIVNYLNLFGFEIDKKPNFKQLVILNGLKEIGIIQEFWLEGETFRTDSFQNQNLPPLIDNDYLKNLNYIDIPERGRGANIIIIEPNATNDKNIIGVDVNIQNFKTPIDTIGEMRFGDIHQNQTLATIYGNKEGTLAGLAPKANLVVGSLSKPPRTDNLTIIFKSKHKSILSLLRMVLSEINAEKFQNSILLLEFETWIPLQKNEPNKGETFPSFIIWDIKNMLEELASKRNIIVVGGVGNSHKNFDEILQPPWENLERYKYENLKKGVFPLIMVAGVDKILNPQEFTINKDSNYGKNVDVYMYTNFKLRETLNFGGTSAASAAVAGIVAFLQGKALSGNQFSGLLPDNPDIQNRKPLTTQMIKNVFAKTFMSRFPKTNEAKINDNTLGLITNVQFNELWKRCMEELNSPLS